jgi:DNA-binding transcriptional LysR family regulator
MDVKDLRYFVAVYETRGFSRASAFLGTVQSNVSSRIRGLEDLLGTPLFERHYRRRVVPTERGVKLYGHAKLVIAALDHTEREMGIPRPHEAQSGIPRHP